MKEFKGPKRQGGWVQLAAAGVGALGSFMGAKKSAKEAKKAAKYQYYAQQDQIKAQKELAAENRKTLEAHKQDMKPYTSAGTNALSKMQELLFGPPPSQYGSFRGLAAHGYGQQGRPKHNYQMSPQAQQMYRNRGFNVQGGRLGPINPMAQASFRGGRQGGIGRAGPMSASPYMSRLQRAR